MTKKSWELQGEASITWNTAIRIMGAWRAFLAIPGEFWVEELGTWPEIGQDDLKLFQFVDFLSIQSM